MAFLRQGIHLRENSAEMFRPVGSRGVTGLETASRWVDYLLYGLSSQRGILNGGDIDN